MRARNVVTALVAMLILASCKELPESKYQPGDAVRHRLTGERAIVLESRRVAFSEMYEHRCRVAGERSRVVSGVFSKVVVVDKNPAVWIREVEIEKHEGPAALPTSSSRRK